MPGDGPTVAALLRTAERELGIAGVDSPDISARVLFEHVLHIDRAGLLARMQDVPSEAVRDSFRTLVQRRARREPLQYIVGTAHFLDFEVAVEPGVFIPRPETEQLVERALECWNSGGWAIDLCCGSGAVAIGLARGHVDGRVLAIDLAPKPRNATRANAATNGVGDAITVCAGDLLAPLGDHAWPELGVLVCNPPYAAAGEVEQAEVLHHEPLDAILSGPQGHEIYERVVPAAARLLPAGAWLLFELGHGRRDAVESLFCDDRWSDLSVDDDFQGIPRVLAARRSGRE